MIYFMLMPTDKRQNPVQIMAFNGADLHDKLLRHHFTGPHFITAYVDHYEWAIIGRNGTGAIDPIFIQSHLIPAKTCEKIYASALRSVAYHKSRQDDLYATRQNLSRFINFGSANRDLFRVPQEQRAQQARFV